MKQFADDGVKANTVSERSVCESVGVAADHRVAVLHTGELTNCLWAEEDEHRIVLRERKERRG